MRPHHLSLVLVMLIAGTSLAQLPKPYDSLSRKSIFARDRVSRTYFGPTTRSTSAETCCGAIFLPRTSTHASPLSAAVIL